MSAPVTLADLVEILDAEVLEAPRGLAVLVGRVVVLDEVDFSVDGPGLASNAVVLMVGSTVGIPDLARNGQPGSSFGALIVRGELSAAQLDFALGAQAAVLRITPRTSWNEVIRRADRIGTDDDSVEFRDSAAGSLDLFGVADTAASIAGGPVTIEDTLHRILAYSADQSDSDNVRIQTLLHRRTPAAVIEQLRRDGQLRTVLASREPVLLQKVSPESGPRLVVPIRSNDEVLGLLWAALPVGTTRLGSGVRAGFKRCADRAATHLVQIDGILGRVRRIEVEQLARLLHSGVETNYADLPGAVSDRVHWVAATAFELSPDRRTHARARVVHVLDRARLTGDAQLIVGDLNDLLYVVVSAPAAQAAVVHRITALIAEVPGTTIGLSTAVSARSEMPRARLQAERALSVARRTDAVARIAVFDDVWPAAALLRLATSPLSSEITSSGPVRRLIELDQANGTEYADTLREYLLSGADSREAATRLNVHVNTVRYRIAKIRDEIAVDIDDPLVRLVITLQLKIIQLQPKGARQSPR